jgi:hypothetical protein
MVLLRDEAQVEARFGQFRDSTNLDSRSVHGLCRMYHRLRNYFGLTRWNSKVTGVMWNLISVHLEIVLILTQDRCMVCNDRTVDLEIVLDATDGTSK